MNLIIRQCHHFEILVYIIIILSQVDHHVAYLGIAFDFLRHSHDLLN